MLLKSVLNYIRADPMRSIAATALGFAFLSPLLTRTHASIILITALGGVFLMLLSRFLESESEVDIGLLIRENYSNAGAEISSANFEVVIRHPNYALVQIWSATLRQHGIPTEIRDEFIGSILYKYSFAAGQIKLLVPPEHLKSAEELLFRSFKQTSASTDGLCCPKCGSYKIRYSRAVHPAMIWLVVTTNVGLPIKMSLNRCLECGERWSADGG